MPVLSRFGQTPLAFELIQSEKLPSWGFPIKHGATSIWERWDGWTPDRGFQNPTMNSFAHYGFGAVGQWMFQTMAGIDAASPGFQKIRIQPEPGEGVDWVKASYRSQKGKIESAWKKERGKLTMDVTIPANTIAVVNLPGNAERKIKPDESKITESGKPLRAAPGVKILGLEDLRVKVEVEAGRYRFEIPWE
jgi:alpha-L-rhamnosidase